MRIVELAKRRGALLWSAALVGIAAWMVHITAASGLVQYICNNEGTTLWMVHLATVVTAVPTAAGTWLCLAVLRSSGDDESSGTLAGNHAFAGLFGVITGAFSLALILFEGSYAFFLDPCA